ncbi:MAG: DUF3127 domain-containing protein [Bacteroidales bacterium]|nr:DUF3127 domain-containing protein [Candidatus Colimorpha onthohippi]
MEVIGKLLKILPEQRGESQRGPWVRGGFVVEVGEDYPRQIAFTTFGEDRLAMLQQLVIGGMVQVNFNIESREYQDRWYTDVRCIRVQNYVAGSQPQPMAGAPAAGTWQPQAQPVAAPQAPFAAVPPVATPGAAPASTQPTASMPASDDDLPF